MAGFGKFAMVLLVVGISYVAASCNKPAWWFGKANWYGASRPWCPGKQASIWTTLELWESKLLVGIPKPGQIVKAGDPGVFWNQVTCPANTKNPRVVVGDCSATGLYVYDFRIRRAQDATTASGDDGLVNWTVVCDIKKPCGDYGVGTISAVGRSGGTTGKGPNVWAIVGGTGAYTALAAKGGEAVNEINTEGTWTFKFRFIRDRVRY